MSTKMSEPRELFLHELGDVLYAERTLVKILPKLQEEASDEELTLGFEEHLDETKQHVKNVEQAFEMLGEKPTAEKCPGIDGTACHRFIANPPTLPHEGAVRLRKSGFTAGSSLSANVVEAHFAGRFRPQPDHS